MPTNTFRARGDLAVGGRPGSFRISGVRQHARERVVRFNMRKGRRNPWFLVH